MIADRDLHNIALIGFMGTGKSSVGRLIADHLHFQFIDTDEQIERRAGKSIANIFAQEGETRFREYEREEVASLSDVRKTVISTGGGLGANPAHQASLKTHSLVICLWASPERIWERVRHQNHRPLLLEADPLARIRQLLAARESVYKEADILLNTDLRPLREVAQQVLHHFHVAKTHRS